MKGGIALEGGGHTPTVTVSLNEELSKLQAQIDDLVAKVTALQAKI
jgi:cell division protein FtsB